MMVKDPSCRDSIKIINYMAEVEESFMYVNLH